MSFSLSVSGHATDPADEKILAASLGQVLKDAGPLVSYASFSGNGFVGDPRDLATESEALE